MKKSISLRVGLACLAIFSFFVVCFEPGFQPALSASTGVPVCSSNQITYALNADGWFKGFVENRVGSWVLIDFGQDEGGYAWKNLDQYMELKCLNP